MPTIGKLGELIYFIIDMVGLKLDSNFLMLFSLGAQSFLGLSYTFKFVLYYLTNNLFKETFHQYVKKFFRIK